MGAAHATDRRSKTTMKNAILSYSRSGTSDRSLGFYLQEIGRNKPLSIDEEARLSEKIRKGDRKALARLVEANLRFVVSVCRNYQNQGLPLGDLINEGNLGLMRGARRFDGRKNYKFISYAVWWIRQGILQALAEQSRIVKIPLNRIGIIYKIGKAQMKLEQEYKRLPTLEEIAKELRLSEKEVRESARVANPHISLDAPLQEGEDSEYIEIICDPRQERSDDHVLDISMQQEIGKILNSLSPREREVLSLYFGIGIESPQTLDEIGKRFRLTRERIRQIKEKALKKLKHSSRSCRLQAYYP
jgi:RNA polymerase primary sigma factor